MVVSNDFGSVESDSITVPIIPSISWNKTFGGAEFDICRHAIVAADGGYLLVGETNSSLGSDITQSGQGGRDYWVVKIDALGNNFGIKIWG